MNTPNAVEALELLLEVSGQLGYDVRYECLGGTTSASCEIAGKKIMFVDLTLNPVEQLDQIATALRADPSIHVADLPDGVRESLGIRRRAA